MTIECNADLGHPCDADNGEPCPRCATDIAAWELWCMGHRPPPSREQYRDDMIDAGRGHLLREDER